MTSPTASVVQVAQWFDAFRQRCYVRGILGKKNDRAADGRPYNMRKWTKWYVELHGPVLVFWNLLDANLAPSLDAISAMADGKLLPGSPLFEDTVTTIKQVVSKPNFINITDASCSVIGSQKKRSGVWELLSSGANRFFMQASDDRAMNDWVLGIRLVCFEAMKLYELYTTALIRERHSALLASNFASLPTSFDVEVRFSGSNDWVPCRMLFVPSPSKSIRFLSSSSPDQPALASFSTVRSAYSIYPDQLDLVDDAVIAKFEGDCNVDPSLLPSSIDHSSHWSRGSYALVIFQTPDDMVKSIMCSADFFHLYGRPDSIANDLFPDSDGRFLSLSDAAGRSVEIMEPVTARSMLNESARALYLERTARPSSPTLDLPAISSDDEPLSDVYNSKHLKQQQQQQKPADDARSFARLQLQEEQDRDSGSSSSLRLQFSGLSSSLSSSSKDKKSKKKSHKDSDSASRSRRSSVVSPSKEVVDPVPVDHSSDDHALGSNGGNNRGNTPVVKEKKTLLPFLKKKKKTTATTTTSVSERSPPSADPPNSVFSSSSSKRSTLLFHNKADSTSSTITTTTTSHVKSNPVSPPSAAETTLYQGLASLSINKVPSPPQQQINSDDGSESDEPLAVSLHKQQQQQQQHHHQKARNSGIASSMDRQGTPGSAENHSGQHSFTNSAYIAGPPSDAFNSIGRASIVPGSEMFQNMMLQQGVIAAPMQASAHFNTMPNGMSRPVTQVYSHQGIPQQPQQQQQFIGSQFPMNNRPTTLLSMADSTFGYGGMNPMDADYDPSGGPLLTLEKKSDPIERPTGLVGAIANREMIRNEQKYRDSSSLMRDRIMRRQQVAAMSGYMGMPGMMRTGSSPHMFGQAQYDDAVSMMSGASGHYGINPALARNSMFMNGGAGQMMVPDPMARFSMAGDMNRMSRFMNPMQTGAPMQQQFSQQFFPGIQPPISAYNNNGNNMQTYNTSAIGMVPGNDDDDAPLSSIAAATVANPHAQGFRDNHPLRAAMSSRMSSSTPHLLGAVGNTTSMYGIPNSFGPQQQHHHHHQQSSSSSFKSPALTTPNSSGSRVPSNSSGINLQGYRSSGNYSASPHEQTDYLGNVGISRNSYMSSGSGSANSSVVSSSSPQISSNGRPLGPQSKWTTIKSNIDNSGGRFGSSTNHRRSHNHIPSPAADSAVEHGLATSQRKKTSDRGRILSSSTSSSPKSQSKVASPRAHGAYELPGKGRSSSHRATRLASNSYLSDVEDDDDGDEVNDDEEEESDSDNPYYSRRDRSNGHDKSTDIVSGKLEHEYPFSISKIMARNFELFLDHCIDIKPYTTVPYNKVYDAYASFCSRNGVKPEHIGSTKQFTTMMGCADWKLDRSGKNGPQYKDICLL